MWKDCTRTILQSKKLSYLSKLLSYYSDDEVFAIIEAKKELKKYESRRQKNLEKGLILRLGADEQRNGNFVKRYEVAKRRKRVSPQL